MRKALSQPVGFHRRAILAIAAGAGLASLIGASAALGQDKAAGTVKIGIIGSGHIGGTVGALWVKAGHPVLFSSRHPEELKEMVDKLGPLAKAGTPEEAIAFGSVVFLAVPYKAYPEIGRDYGKALAGKTVLDAGNATPARDGELASEAKENGIGLTSAKYLPGAHVVRAFNTLGYTILARESHRTGDPMAIPIAGDDQNAVKVAAQLVRDAGFDPVVAGGLATAKEFQIGAPGYGQQVTAPELRKKLGLSSQ